MIEPTKKPEYISVGELSVGFSEHSLQPTHELVGNEYTFYYEDGTSARLTFTGSEHLEWLTADGGLEASYVSSYSAVSPRPDWYFIDFIIESGGEAKQSVSILLNLRQNIALVITGILPGAAEMRVPMIERAKEALPLSSVTCRFEHASINAPFTALTPRCEETAELIGKRIEFVYSSKDVYEHIYLNEKMYTWHCINGSEKGLCDTDRCFYYKLDDEFYLFVWMEKVIPTLGIVLEDLKAMRSYGKIYGYESHDAGTTANFPVGSYAKEK
ncbi:hypothetical protein J2Z22_001317 [Paenibacillus forsythiae]|uniref:Molybdenum cofactor biosynthesis protein F n=1 Tax=Paenibacillus forsythiae TaxID=365616 RepID=A0ABU3H4Q8_9BACL|nr:MoaF C-terminal domain-containing protein [Paenibacillus forsythiae]MDT3425798.1 hypothetical protein [Paenibacillus forsythiae]